MLAYIARFADQTGHRPHQYESPAQVKQMLQKCLAAQVRATPWQDVFYHISPADMRRVEVRSNAAGQPVEKMPPPPVQFYTDLAKEIRLFVPRDSVALHFAETLFPGYDHTTKGDAQIGALFLAAAHGADTRQLLREIYNDRDTVNRLSSAISHYAWPAPKIAAHGIAQIIKAAKFPGIEEGTLFVLPPNTLAEGAEERFASRTGPEAPPAQSALSLLENDPKDVLIAHWGPAEESVLRGNKRIIDWKRVHGIHHVFPSRSVAKQMIIAEKAPSEIPLLQERNLLGRWQSTPTHSPNLKADTQIYQMLLAQMPHVSELVDLPEVVEYRRIKGNVQDGDTERTLLARYMEQAPALTPAFIKVLL